MKTDTNPGRPSADPEPSSNAQAGQTAAGWAADILNDRFRLLLDALAPACQQSFDDPEVVHQLRVSCRRVVAALQLLQQFFTAGVTPRFIHRLKRLRRSAGEARDIDVLLERWKQAKKPLSDKQHHRVIRFLSRRRKAVLQKLSRSLARHSPEELQQHFSELISASASAEMSGRTAQRDLLTAAVTTYLAGSEGPYVTIDDWHRVRIQGKRLRYALELLRATEWKDDVAAILTLLREFQDRLGTMNDHSAAALHLRNWRRKTSSEKLRKALKRLRRTESKQLQQSLESVRKWWSDERQAELNTNLLALVQRSRADESETAAGVNAVTNNGTAIE